MTEGKMVVGRRDAEFGDVADEVRWMMRSFECGVFGLFHDFSSATSSAHSALRISTFSEQFAREKKAELVLPTSYEVKNN